MIDPAAVLAHRFEDRPVRVTERDAILYALGIGLGDDPVSPGQLKFTYEGGLQVFPTMPVVLGSPGLWFRAPGLGIDAARVVHAEQELRNHRPVRVGEALIARNEVRGLVDKGAGRGALLTVGRTLQDEQGAAVATSLATYFLRGDGGFGGPAAPSASSPDSPERPPDLETDVATLPQAALIYRLSGDTNPLHADPAFARRAGLDRPILHGLCTFAMAGRAVMDAGQGGTLRVLRARMSAPVIPGDTIRVTGWRQPGGIVQFIATVPARGATVLTQGHAELSEADHA